MKPVEEVFDEVPGGEKGDPKAKAKTSAKFSHEGDDGVDLEMGTYDNFHDYNDNSDYDD